MQSREKAGDVRTELMDPAFSYQGYALSIQQANSQI